MQVNTEKLKKSFLDHGADMILIVWWNWAYVTL